MFGRSSDNQAGDDQTHIVPAGDPAAATTAPVTPAAADNATTKPAADTSAASGFSGDSLNLPEPTTDGGAMPDPATTPPDADEADMPADYIMTDGPADTKPATTTAGTTPDPAPEPPAADPAPAPEPPVATPVPSPDPAPAGDIPDDLADIKQQALKQLSPLVNHLELSPEDRFRTTMMMLQATDDQGLIREAYAAAQAIPDDKVRAQALLDVVNEINYFTQPSNQN